ncbi:hypothetical protein DLM77_20665 [Leptospira yasudae]|uniref:Uncharacterized protein n=1 Tax=Leptospira yasudae TaxID=2202201 RepID=A0ABX9LXI4_9LEPT|nr:hypothetical protein DLM77_20665 [Leptospira yasudae]
MRLFAFTEATDCVQFYDGLFCLTFDSEIFWNSFVFEFFQKVIHFLDFIRLPNGKMIEPFVYKSFRIL